MKETFLKKRIWGATRAARSESSASILLLTGYSVNQALPQWRSEATRLWSEYQRTANVQGLYALQAHLACVRQRLAL